MFVKLTITGAIITQILLTTYYIYFIIRPLSELEKIRGKINYGYRLLIIRTISVLLMDIIDYRLSTMLDVVLLLILAFGLVPKIKKDLNYIQSVDTKLAQYNELTTEELSEYGFKNKKILEEKLFNKLKLIQTSRTNFDYDTLKRICTEKRYNVFANELRMLEESGLSYHYDNYKLLKMQIYEIKSTAKEIVIKAAIKDSCTFFRKTKEGKIIEGSKKLPTVFVHELEYVKYIDLKDVELNCPNCGAPTKTTTKGRCLYCNTIISEDHSDWKIANYKVVAEKIQSKNSE